MENTFPGMVCTLLLLGTAGQEVMVPRVILRLVSEMAPSERRGFENEAMVDEAASYRSSRSFRLGLFDHHGIVNLYTV